MHSLAIFAMIECHFISLVTWVIDRGWGWSWSITPKKVYWKPRPRFHYEAKERTRGLSSIGIQLSSPFTTSNFRGVPVSSSIWFALYITFDGRHVSWFFGSRNSKDASKLEPFRNPCNKWAAKNSASTWRYGRPKAWFCKCSRFCMPGNEIAMLIMNIYWYKL